MQKKYKTAESAVAAFLRNGKKDGTVTVLGGGWWQIKKLGKVQGLGKLEVLLKRRGWLVMDGTQAALVLPAKQQEVLNLAGRFKCPNVVCDGTMVCGLPTDHPSGICDICRKAILAEQAATADGFEPEAADVQAVLMEAELKAVRNQHQLKATTVRVQDTAKDMGIMPARRPGRPKADKTKVQLCIRIDEDVLERFRASGTGWQTRMQDILKVHAPRPRKAGKK